MSFLVTATKMVNIHPSSSTSVNSGRMEPACFFHSNPHLQEMVQLQSSPLYLFHWSHSPWPSQHKNEGSCIPILSPKLEQHSSIDPSALTKLTKDQFKVPTLLPNKKLYYLPLMLNLLDGLRSKMKSPVLTSNILSPFHPRFYQESYLSLRRKL